MDNCEENIGKIFEFEMKPIRELYYNEQNFYSISVIELDEELPGTEKDKINNKYTTKLVGRSVPLSTSSKYKVTAKFIFNEKYGYQYEIVSIKPIVSEESQSTLNNSYLQAIITPNQYETLNNAYPNIVQNLLDDPNFEPDYTKLKGIKQKSWEKIREKILKYQQIGDILALLVPLGVSSNMIDKLVSYEPNVDILKTKLKSNPYEFTRIQGFGFLTVDKLALKINPDLATSSFRVAACTRHVLEEEAMNGYLWVSIQDFGKDFCKIIPPGAPEFNECFKHVKDLIQVERELTKDNNSTLLHVVDDVIGLQKYYNIEESIWKYLKRLNNTTNYEPNRSLEEAIEETNNYFSTADRRVELTDEQISAIKSTIENKVVIITANAGAGKTVCIKGILNLFRNYNVATAALSGKAARRIEEATGVPSNTIHRLLEWQVDGGFARNEDNPLNVDLIILDECSMIDDILLLNLLKAMPAEAKLVLVFDDAQLSPIGAGSPAKDLLSSNLCINRLTKIHRQAESSGIKLDANKIRKNQDIFTDEDIDYDEFGNRFITSPVIHGADKDMEIYMYTDSKMSQDKIFQQAYDLYFDLLRENDGNVDKVTIVVPKKDGVNSTRNFNNRIQERLLGREPSELVIKESDDGKYKVFKKGARVIQRNVNDYERNVMNGEIGIIENISEKFCTLNFDNGEKIVQMPKPLMRNMELAYAITVHSMQGSECENVIAILDNSHYILLDCALFYTAVTRAQKKCYLLMQPSAYKNALLKNKTERRTYLKDIIKEDIS
mgnify:FL=1